MWAPRQTNQPMVSPHCWSGVLDTWWFLTQPPRSCYDYRFSSRRLERARESERERKGGRETDSLTGRDQTSKGKERKVLPRGWMDAGDGWHVAGGESVAQDKRIFNRVMLRFRPIAPKPAAVGSSSGPISPDKKSPHLTSKRVKRKYIRVGKNNNNNNSGSGRRLINTSSSAEEEKPKAALDSAIVTLQLMPEKTDYQDFPVTGSWCRIDPTVAKIPDNRDLRTWINQNPKMSRSVGNEYVAVGPDRTAMVPGVMAVESWVTVESVTDTCMDVGGLGCTDVEKMRILEKDTCPGFISDGSNRVKWVNEAYKRMVVSQCEGQQAAEIIVWLVTKANLPPYGYRGFTCRVRVEYYTWQKEKCSKMVPCDVWRMECGLAWRLDIKAALSLGL